MKPRGWIPGAFLAVAVLGLIVVSVANWKRSQSNARPGAAPPARVARPATMPPGSPDAKETAAAIINLNGLLCAEVVAVRRLELADTLEVTCIEFRGGSHRAAYAVNLRTGKATKL